MPTWASDPTIGYKTINARSETAATTPSFREPFKSHRCLIPADGFYEWQKNGKTKQPYCFEVNGGDLFAFAGLWDRWTSPQGEVIESCTILNVILSPYNYRLWLYPAISDTVSVPEMLRPFDAGLMRRYPVSTRVIRRRTMMQNARSHSNGNLRQRRANCFDRRHQCPSIFDSKGLPVLITRPLGTSIKE